MKSPASVTPRGRKAKLNPHNEFYAAIGRFVMTWADLEVCLDLLLLTIRPKDQAATQRKSKLPYQFEPKIALVRSHTKDLDSPHRASIIELLDEISPYADHRHDFVHGAIIGHYIEEGVITATLGRLLQPSENRPRRNSVKVTALEIIEISDRISGFGDRLLDITQALLYERKAE